MGTPVAQIKEMGGESGATVHGSKLNEQFLFLSPSHVQRLLLVFNICCGGQGGIGTSRPPLSGGIKLKD